MVAGIMGRKKERKKTDNPREGWENGTPPPHRDFKERGVVRHGEAAAGAEPLPKMGKNGVILVIRQNI